MKKQTYVQILICLLFFSTIDVSFSQKENKEENCYTKWWNFFSNRGGFPISNGKHHDVIISVRKGREASCYTGRVHVVDNTIQLIEIQLQDDTYEKFNTEKDLGKKHKKKHDITVRDGISESIKTDNGEIVNIFFPKNIKPKKKAYKKAPEPSLE